MDESLIKQEEYEAQQLRESRKLADKLYRAHKRRLLQAKPATADPKLPILKIDIQLMPHQQQLLKTREIQGNVMTILNRLVGLQKGLPDTTVGGLIVNSPLTREDNLFDQIYIGDNGHIGLRCERMFLDGEQPKVVQMMSVATLLDNVLELARAIYDMHDIAKRYADNADPIVVKVELSNVLDMQANEIPDPSGDEFAQAVLPQYAAEKRFAMILGKGQDGSNSITKEMRTDLQAQLGIWHYSA